MQFLDLQRLPDRRLFDLQRQLQLYDQLNDDEGIHGLIEKAATLFGNPVTLLDPELRLITRASSADDHPPACGSLAVSGMCEMHCGSCFTDSHVKEAIHEASSSIYIAKHPAVPIGRILTKVCRGDRILAYLLIFECRGDLSLVGELELADTLAKIVGIEMRQGPVVTLFEEGENGALLASILSGRPIRTGVLEQHSTELGDSDDPFYQLLYLPSLQHRKEFFGIDYFSKRLADVKRKPHFLFKDGAYLLVFSVRHELELRGLDHELTAILEEAGLHASLGERFTNLLDLPYQLEVCELLYDYARGREPGTALHRLGTHIIGLLMNAKLNANDNRLIHPDLCLLHRYDEENNAQLLMTWITYLKAHKHLTNAADLLAVHKNTLVYRLKKIQDLTVSLSEENDGISYQLLSYEKLLRANSPLAD